MKTYKLLKNIGESKSVCPYCKKILVEKPKKKTNCHHCKKTIYCRTRPYDNAKILIRDNQRREIDFQKSISNHQKGGGEQLWELQLLEQKVWELAERNLKKELGIEDKNESFFQKIKKSIIPSNDSFSNQSILSHDKIQFRWWVELGYVYIREEKHKGLFVAMQGKVANYLLNNKENLEYALQVFLEILYFNIHSGKPIKSTLAPWPMIIECIKIIKFTKEDCFKVILKVQTNTFENFGEDQESWGKFLKVFDSFYFNSNNN